MIQTNRQEIVAQIEQSILTVFSDRAHILEIERRQKADNSSANRPGSWTRESKQADSLLISARNCPYDNLQNEINRTQGNIRFMKYEISNQKLGEGKSAQQYKQ